MLKYALIAGLASASLPALAQKADKTAVAPHSSAQAYSGAGATPIVAGAAAATTTEQVSTIVNAEFATYDRNGNGMLEKEEFAAWMDALKARAPDGGDRPGDVKWNEAAFAKADTDKSASLTPDELTGFLGSTVKSAGD